MRVFTSLFFILFTFSLAFGQGAMDSNDPEATKILEKIKKEYEDLSSIALDFQLTISFPEEPEEIQKGTMIQKGENYKVDTEQQAIYSNGETVWMHLKNSNEVQIDNPSEGQANMMSPSQLMSFYESGDFLYFITGEETKNGIKYHKIEFKPIDKDSEFSKMRVTVRKADNQLGEIIVFSKDGSRYSLEIQNVKKNQKYTQNVFTFEPSLYPGIHVEDLRID